MRPRLRAQPGPACRGGGGAVERLRLWRDQRHAGVPAVRGLGRVWTPAGGPVQALEQALGHRFADPGLLERALTHPSHAHEHPPAAGNEALAFLGDSVLGLLVAEALFRRDPEAGPGPLTEERARLVSGRGLAARATALDLGAALRLGRGEDLAGGRGKESILASALEAVLGAVFLDGGLDAARRVVERLGVAAGPAPAPGAPGAAVVP